ncbi:hypothetical protein GE107_08825 [Cohnella sp. CFH 77786]|uniref:hypothetical protein n=1 Tax=Cohnella sp. CFH 77786 TaxID=2662265 RepID=UPI001C60DB02|nr:hypothetical protein [Cohnella sp. CFH 77786]MBW5446163.1 hypothetical protein [Cohnella sp. CFH 77786]
MAKRFDGFFTAIHKGVRYGLAHASLKVSSMDFTDSVQVDELVQQCKPLFRMLHSHAEHEDHYCDPIYKEQSVEKAQILENDHVSLDKELTELDRLLQTIAQMENPNERLEISKKFVLDYFHFASHYLAHLHREETIGMEMLWAARTDEQLIALGHEIESNIPPEKMGLFLQYMIPGCNIHDRLEMFGPMKKFAPPEVFEAAGKLARSVLSADDWAELEARLA